MIFEMRPLACDPKRLRGLSEKLILSHYENNYGGAVKRLGAITAQLDTLDFAGAPVFVINGLKREQLIAANSMILHSFISPTSGKARCPRAPWQPRWRATSAAYSAGGRNSLRWARRWAAARAGCCSRIRIATGSC